MQTPIIKIEYSETNDGYMYDICDSTDEGAESLNGGLCTTTIENAIEMAKIMALEIISDNNK